MAEKNERHTTYRAFASRPEIKDTFEDHIKDGSARFETHNVTK
jgi:hypothetical protein